MKGEGGRERWMEERMRLRDGKELKWFGGKEREKYIDGQRKKKR